LFLPKVGATRGMTETEVEVKHESQTIGQELEKQEEWGWAGKRHYRGDNGGQNRA